MSGFFSRSWVLWGGSLLLMGALVALLVWRPTSGKGKQRPLVVFCAAGLKGPVETVAREYEQRYGVPVQLQYGGSQVLLASLAVSQRGDVFIPADESYLQMGRAQKLVAEVIPLARMQAVLAVKKGGTVRSFEDLLGQGVKIGQANPEAAAIGRLTREALQTAGQWEAIERRTVVFRPTVNDIANDLKLGAIEAAFIWDTMLVDYPELEAVPAPALANARARLAVGILKHSEQPVAALRLARFLGARDQGLRELARRRFQVVDGDAWTEAPEIVLYCGAMNRVAVEETIQQFERREGARVTRVYNGCGILVAQMKAGGRPDAYLTCDRSFLPPVANLFPAAPVEMSDSEIVILVAKGNPKGIRSLADLARAGLRVGVGNPEQSTLGALTRRMLEQDGLLGPVMTQVVTQTPTADLLVNQMRIGALDAVVVYDSNTTNVREHLDLVRLPRPDALAVQTFSVRQNSDHKQLAGRLLEALRSEASRARYQAAGFRWRAEEARSGAR